MGLEQLRRYLDYKDTNSMPNQRNSWSEKRKASWYVPTYEYIINTAQSLKNNEDTIQNLKNANGEIDETTYKYVLKPFNKQLNTNEVAYKLPGEIRHTDFVSEIREKTIGRYIEFPFNFQVVVEGSDIVDEQDKRVSAELNVYLQQELINLLNKQLETGVDSKQQPDIEKFVKAKTEEFLNEKAIEAKHIVNLLYRLIDFDIQRVQQYFYWWATEEVYDYRDIINDSLEYFTIPPHEGFPILSSYSNKVEDGFAFVWKKRVMFDDILTYYRNDLEPEDLTFLQSLINDTNGVLIPDGVLKSRMDVYGDFYSGATTDGIDNYITGSDRQINQYIIIWKTQEEVSILRYVNELGQELETIVPSSYELDEANGDLSLYKDWIYRVTKGIRFGDDLKSINLKPKPVMVQMRDKDNPAKCKLNVTGNYGILNNVKIAPIPKRIVEYQAVDYIINLHIEREMARFKNNILTIPKSILKGSDYDPFEFMFYLKADGTLIYDDAEMNADEVSKAVRVVGNPGLERYLQVLIELGRRNRELAYETAYMNQESRGNIPTNALKSNAEQNIYRAQLGSVLSMQMFNNYLMRSTEANLEFSKYAWIDGKKGSYVDPDTKKTVLVSVNPDEHLYRNYGIFISNGLIDAKRLEEFKQLAFSAAQNQDFELAGEAITFEGTAQAKETIKKLTEAKRVYEQQLQAQEDARVQAQIQSNEKLKAGELEFKQWEIIYTETAETERTILTLENELLKVASSGMDKTDSEVAKYKQDLDERLMRLKEKQEENKIMLANKEMVFKEKELQAKKEIAAKNRAKKTA